MSIWITGKGKLYLWLGGFIMREDYLYQEAVQLINDLLLNDRIRLSEIPKELRLSKTSIYSSALRISNGLSCQRYIEDLKILCKDILTSDINLQRDMKSYLECYLLLNNYEGNERFERFKKVVQKKVLSKL